ncbi:uncharacterized protein LOC143026165 isoform X2 [Oratosquilla oratoria]|uniref:uncharacterized protein LOC143026165 isoform X2 n=1 Tax=Oratosquilla oratoria TaxID=337810 RepID=UPI003F76EEF9
MAEQNDVVSIMKDFKSGLESDIEKLKSNMDGEALIEEPDFSIESDKTLDVNLKNKLSLESEIEALVDSDFYVLPKDSQTLLSLAEEGTMITKDQSRRNLNYYNEKVESLKKEKAKLQHLVNQAAQVDKKLDEIIQNQSETEVMAPLLWRYNMTGVIFKELRTELNDFLQDRFPQQNTATKYFHLDRKRREKRDGDWDQASFSL